MRGRKPLQHGDSVSDAVFDAKGEAPPDRPAEMWIGECVVMVSDGGGLRDAAPAFLYVYVPDVDAAYARAVKAKAETIEAPRRCRRYGGASGIRAQHRA